MRMESLTNSHICSICIYVRGSGERVPAKKSIDQKNQLPQKRGGQRISRAAAPREPPTTTIFGDVGINVGVDNILTAFARMICQFLNVAA
jgi:hypothetical protein